MIQKGKCRFIEFRIGLLMKILHFNTYSTHGGAAQAAYQLHKSLGQEGLDSLMLVKNKDKTLFDNSVVEIPSPAPSINIIKKIFQKSLFGFACKKLYSFYENKKNRKWKNLSTTFNNNTDSISLNSIKKYLVNVDIICLYW
ncbi:MAG: hypothetical protein IH948_07670, partial [Bacteroidetes bacterium]|nr:hypothetical protein [Bacteroidota bacterium]